MSPEKAASYVDSKAAH